MRVIKNFGTRELILMGVELPWIFLLNYCYGKLTDLVRRKGRIETKKQKDVRHDGMARLGNFEKDMRRQGKSTEASYQNESYDSLSWKPLDGFKNVFNTK